MIDLYSANWVDTDRYELRADARRFENWENNYSARLGLGSAVDYALEIGLADIEAEISRLAGQLRSMLAEVPGISGHDIGSRKCGIVSFPMAGMSAGDIESGLRQHGINVSVSSPNSTLVDAKRRHLPEVVRASVHYYNQHSELEKLVELLRSMSSIAG